MLADRLASFIAGHDPGWRIPQPTALAKRFSVSVVEIESALRELIRRRLLRQLPDGRIYRPSPADYLIALEGLPVIGASIDPIGGSLTCASRHVTWQRIPEDLALMLGLLPATECSIIRCMWTVNGCRAAVSTTYLARPLDAAHDDGSPPAVDGPGQDIPVSAPTAILGSASGAGPAATTAHLEFQVPAQSAVRSLELAPGEPAITVAVRFHDPARALLVALTAVVLRADMFRVIIDAPAGSPPAGGAGDLSAAASAFAAWDS